MIDMEEREIRRVRLRLLDLAKSFLLGEPDAEKMSRWRGTFNALVRERINPVFDRSVLEIHSLLESKTLKELQDEYYRLFVDPFGEALVDVSASYHLEGRSYGHTLVELRGFLAEAGLVKYSDVFEPEDSLVVLLDVLSRLIDDENGFESEKVQQLQDELLQKYLIPLSSGFCETCDSNEAAVFYRACAHFLAGYLELERGFMGTEAA